MAEEQNAAEVHAWAKDELLRSRFEVSLAVHHMLLLVAVFYVAVVAASLWWGYFELIEHGKLQSWWHWLAWGMGFAAFWFVVFALVFAWTQTAVIRIAHSRARRRVA
jgi:hypothetical protein